MKTDLELRLGTAGLDCRVEARERLAILIPSGSHDAEEKAWSLARVILQDAGFSHVAVELDPDGAALHRG